MATILNQFEVGPFNAGVNLSMLPEEIADNEAVAIQDMWLNKPGQIYTRGPVRNLVNPASPVFGGSTKIARGIVSTVAPDGNTHTACVSQDHSVSALYFDILADDGHNIATTLTIDVSPLPTTDILVDAKPAAGGGVWVGIQGLNASVSLSGPQYLFHWRGATKVAYSTGTITATLTNPVITGAGTSWVANASPGMFLVDSTSKKLLGVVKSVDSNTQITLEASSNYAIAAAGYNLYSIRSWGNEVSKGRIKTVLGSTTVTGSGTKFQAQAVGSNYALFRLRDNGYIGTVASTPTGDEGLTLAAGANLALDNEPFVARLTAGNPDPYFTYRLPSGANLANYPGVLNATYAGLQWFARLDSATFVGSGDMHSRAYFADERNMNSIDIQTVDGDFIPVASTVGQNLPIRGFAASAHALLVFKENETFAITGSDPTTFVLQKIWDDGCLSPMSIVQYKGAVIWCGRNGVYIFDGKEVKNLVARSLGAKYSQAVAYFDPRLHKICAACFNDHYIFSLHTTGNDPSGQGATLWYPMKNGTPSGTGLLSTAAVYIPTQALSFQSGFYVIGAAKQTQNAWLLSASSPNAFSNANVSDFQTLWSSSTGVDTFSAVGSTPDPYFESKRYSCGDPLRKKRFREIIVTHSPNTIAHQMETAIGLGDSSLASSWTLSASQFASVSLGVEVTARIKFHGQERFVAFKFYDITGTNSRGWWELRRFLIGFKWNRPGRV